MTVRALHFLKTSVGAGWGLRQMRELVKLGVEVHVALPDGPLIESYKAAGINVHFIDASINLRNPLANFRVFSSIRKLVDEIAPDVIHSHFVATTLALRMALGPRHPVRRIFHVPGPLHLEHPFFRIAEIMVSGRADFWLASCEWTRQRYIHSGIDPARVGLVYYGVDLPAQPSGRSGMLRHEYGVSDDAPVVGNVAYFYAPKRYLGQKVGLKGHEDLIAAVDLAGRHIPDLTCFLVGGPWAGADWYFERVKKLAEAASNVRIILTGYRSDVHEIYQDFDVAVHPSHSENVGGAVESLLHEVPTIATNVGGFPDLVRDGESGWLVPPKSPESLAEAIVLAFSDHEEAIARAKAGRRLVEQLLDVRQNARDILTYYNNLLETGLLTPEAQSS
jgi:glycosyltransferase involved in cell wall biosynthesis